MCDTSVVWTALTSTLTYKEEEENRLRGVGGGALMGIVTQHPKHCFLMFTEGDTAEVHSFETST